MSGNPERRFGNSVVGGSGHRPLPSGDPPDGRAEGAEADPGAASLNGGVLVPIGGSPAPPTLPPGSEKPCRRTLAGPPPADELVFRNRHPQTRVDLRRLRRIVLAALAECSTPPGVRQRHELAFFLVDASAMTELNETHLGHHGPTDVITFDYGVPETARSDERWVRGDIFLCPEVARRQARRYGTTWPAELVRYAVHGLLHLQGLDDRSPAARRVMKREENRVVRRLAARFPFHQLPVRSGR